MKPEGKKPTGSKKLFGDLPNTKILIIKSRYERFKAKFTYTVSPLLFIPLYIMDISLQRFKAKFTYTVSPLLFIPLYIMDISLHPTGLEKSLYSSLSFKKLAPTILFARTFALLKFLGPMGKRAYKVACQARKSACQ